MMTLAATALAATGCGGGSDDKPAPQQGLRLSAASAPSVADCAFEDAKSLDRPASGGDPIEAPAPGTYSYETRGTEAVPGESRRPLPATTKVSVTPSRRSGGLSCVGFVRRWSDRTTTSEVYVLRGEDVYVTAIGLDTPNQVESVAPRPAILALSGSGTAWKGAFAGDTTGSYEMEIIGRRTVRVGGESVRAVGIETRARYSGDAAGSRRTTSWLALDRALVLSEEGDSSLRVGGGDEKLSYTTKLTSLEASG